MNGPVPIRAVLAPHLHLDKLRYLKVIAQLLYRALCRSDEFHLSGLQDADLVLAGSGTLRSTRSSASAWMVVCSSAAFPSTTGNLRSPECSVWGAPKVHMDNVGRENLPADAKSVRCYRG